MSEIQSLALGKLHEDEAAGFHQLACAETAKCKHEKVVPLQAVYAAAFEKWDAVYKRSTTHPLSQTIASLDAGRDSGWSGLNGIANVAANHFLPAKADIGQQARAIIRKYGNPTELPLVEESGALHNLIQDLEALDQTAAPAEGEEVTPSPLTQIGAREWLDYLKEKEEQFLAAFAERNTDQGNNNLVGQAAEAHKATDNAYRAIVKRINALTEIEGDEAFIGVINALNNLIERQKTVLATRATLNAKK